MSPRITKNFLRASPDLNIAISDFYGHWRQAGGTDLTAGPAAGLDMELGPMCGAVKSGHGSVEKPVGNQIKRRSLMRTAIDKRHDSAFEAHNEYVKALCALAKGDTFGTRLRNVFERTDYFPRLWCAGKVVPGPWWLAGLLVTLSWGCQWSSAMGAL